MKATHSQRLERWMGTERIEQLSRSMKGWYGPPIHILDVPGSVRICADGDFIGPFDRGYFGSALDSLHDIWRRMGRVRHGTTNAGFASVGDALSRSSGGFGQVCPVRKAGSTGVVASSHNLWNNGNTPSGGSIGAAAPGGTVCASSDVGALAQYNPASGTLHLVGADISASIINNSLMIYDRLFSVAKTMASTATEAVSGVPTRYQSTTTTDPDYIGGNFGFITNGNTVLSATAHNWTTCLYLDQANASSTLPSVTGNSACIADRFDQPVGTWFTPLAAGDTGIKAWTQMQCSASVAAGSISFNIGHPLGVVSFPIANTTFPFDWITNRNQAPRVFDDACVAMFEMTKPSTNATNYTGAIYFTSAA